MKVWVYRSRNGNHRVFTGDAVGFANAREQQDADNRMTLDETKEEGYEYGGSYVSGCFWIDDGGDIELFDVE